MDLPCQKKIDETGFKHRRALRRLVDAYRAAVDVERIGVCLDGSVVEADAVCLDRVDVAEANHILDLTQQVEFAPGDDGGTVGARFDIGIESHQNAVRLQQPEQVRD